MYPLTAFLLAVSGAMLIGLVLVLAWALSRERYFEQQMEQKENQYAEALKREGQLSAQTAQLLDEQARSRVRAQRMEEALIRRAEVIRDLGIDPERLEQTRESLLGVLAILRVRVGLLLASELNRVALRDVAQAAGGRTAEVFRQLDDRLRGEGGPHHDQQSRQLLRELLDISHLEKPVSERPERMIE